MTCAEARAALLELPLEQLRPGAAGPMGQHLAECAACRAAAHRIVTGTAALAATRDRAALTAAAVVARAALARGRRLRTRQRRLRVLVPLLAAASLALVFVRDVPHRSALAPPVAAQPALPPLVEGGGQDLAVIATTRPDVTIVWQF